MKVKSREPRMSEVALLGQREALKGVTFWQRDFALSHDSAPSAGKSTRLQREESWKLS